MSSNKSRDRGAVFEIVVLKDKKKDATSTPKQSSHYQSLMLNKKAAQKECSGYMTPTPRQKEVNKTTEEDEKFANSEIQSVDKQQNRSGEQNSLSSKCVILVILLGVGIIVTLVASLGFAGYNNSQMDREKLESLKQLQLRDDMIMELYQQNDNLTELLKQMQEKLERMEVKMERQNEEMTRTLNSTRNQVGAIDTLLSSSIESTATRFTQTQSTLAILKTNVSSVNTTLRDYITEQITGTRSDVSTQINVITTNVADLMNSRVRLSQSCHKETSRLTCSGTTSALYFECNTGYLPVNRTVSIKYIKMYIEINFRVLSTGCDIHSYANQLI